MQKHDESATERQELPDYSYMRFLKWLNTKAESGTIVLRKERENLSCYSQYKFFMIQDA